MNFRTLQFILTAGTARYVGHSGSFTKCGTSDTDMILCKVAVKRLATEDTIFSILF